MRRSSTASSFMRSGYRGAATHGRLPPTPDCPDYPGVARSTEPDCPDYPGGDELSGGDEPVVDELRPRLHLQVQRPHLFERQQLATELLRLSDRDVRSVPLDEEHDPQVDLRHRRRLFVQQAEQLRVEVTVIRHLLLPLALEAVGDRVSGQQVARVDVAADPQRVLLPQPSLRRGAQAVRDEIAIAMPEDDVRNDLLVARVILDLGARLEHVALSDDGLVAVEILTDEPVPRAVRKDVIAAHAQHLLRRGRPHALGIIRTRPRPNTATSSAVRSMSSSATGRK